MEVKNVNPKTPEFQDQARIRHLEATAREALDALDQAAALADFSISFGQLGGPEPVLTMCLERVAGIAGFTAMGVFLVDESDSSFRLASCVPQDSREVLETLVADSIEHGSFAFALREKRSVLLPGEDRRPARLLHVMTTAARTRGMFAAQLKPGTQMSEISMSLLSVVLRNTAQALESYSLYRHIHEMNSNLGSKVAAMEAANRQLKELERLKTAFLSSVSHELRTPLTSILGFAKLIGRDFEKHFLPDSASSMEGKAKRILRNLEIVEKESERLTRLINDVLDLSRIESGKMLWRDQTVDIAALAADAVMAVEGRMGARTSVALRTDIPADLPLVLADRDRILQVLINLLDNALKFTQEGYVLVRACCDTGERILVQVEDTGPGVEPEESQKIFDSFHQHDRPDTLKDKPMGTGMGLAICRQIVTRHGGSIWVEPAPEGGSLFCFTLPLAPVSET